MVQSRFRLDGKVAIVSGGGRGIGRAAALALADAGADVAIAARREEDVAKVAAEVTALGRRAIAMPTDVTRFGEIDRLVEETVAHLGRVDVLVNNAGGWPPTVALALSDDDFAAAYHFNVTSVLHASRAVAPHMKRAGGGAIVNVSSAMARQVDVGFAAYGAAKAALEHLTRLLAAEWAPHVRVNAIAPGAIATDALDFVAAMPEAKAEMVARTPMRRLGDPEDVAAGIVYLASPASAYVTGKVLEVDGGAVASVFPFKIPGGLDEIG